jgi:hypothetical protein
MLSKILVGTDHASQRRLNTLFETIGHNPNIAWYPSAGFDFLDVYKLSEISDFNFDVIPDVFIHTDYYKPVFDNIDKKILYNYNNIQIRKYRSFTLAINSDCRINYHVSPNYADFPDDIYPTPVIYLFDLFLMTENGFVEKTVLYFFFENINFLQEVLIKFNINISHLIKIREGCGFGGNNKSISSAYYFLNNLKVNYLICDNEVHEDIDLINDIKYKYNIKPLDYQLSLIHTFGTWSDVIVNVYKLQKLNNQLSDDDFLRHLYYIILYGQIPNREFILSKSALQNSLFYSLSNFDLFPLLKFGDFVTDFIYVDFNVEKSFLINDRDFILQKKILKIQNNLINTNLTLVSTQNIASTKIELSEFDEDIPSYLTPKEYNRYTEKFLYSNADLQLNLTNPFFSCRLYIFELTVNGLTRYLRLFHLNTDPLKAYNTLFRLQNIAPKIYLTIINSHDYLGNLNLLLHYSDLLFNPGNSVALPKIWIRGESSRNKITLQKLQEGINNYNNVVCCVSSLEWEINDGDNLLAVAFSNNHTNSKSYKEITHKINGLIVIKKIFPYENINFDDYSINPIHISMDNLDSVIQTASQLFGNDPELVECKIPVIPCQHEVFESALNTFLVRFIPVEGKTIILEIFYSSELHLHRYLENDGL